MHSKYEIYGFIYINLNINYVNMNYFYQTVNFEINTIDPRPKQMLVSYSIHFRSPNLHTKI